jgi:hypothetical protein|tara:strand:- start:229 stop:402 length:174 start_codon:yes stop_codon:yes gene_type:complete
MNIKAQAQVFGIMFGAIGFVMGYVMTKAMQPGIFWSITTIICCTIVGYMIPVAVANK